MRTLDQCTEVDRNRFLTELKLYVEDELCRNTNAVNSEWEVLRQENLSDHSVVVLMFRCSQCKERYPVTVDLVKFLDLPKKDSSGKINLKMDCMKCNAELSVNLLNVVNIFKS
jgi:hypothetical protein